jgi:hypothetical protein
MGFGARKVRSKSQPPFSSPMATSWECRADVSLLLYRQRRLGQRLCEVMVAPLFSRFQNALRHIPSAQMNLQWVVIDPRMLAIQWNVTCRCD